MKFTTKLLVCLLLVCSRSVFACAESEIPYSAEIVEKEAYESKDSFDSFLVKLPYIHNGWELSFVFYRNGTISIPIQITKQDENHQASAYFHGTVAALKAATVEAIYHPLPNKEGDLALCVKSQVISFGI